MYLSRIEPNLRSASVLRDLSDIQRMHCRVMSGFPHAPGPGRQAHGVLWRSETSPGRPPVIIVQSLAKPDWTGTPPRDVVRPPQARDASALRGALTQGAVFRFRLVANVTRRIDTKTGADGKRRNGKRVPLRDPERQLAWLARKGQEGGFQLATDAQAVRQVRITPLPLVRSPRGRGVTLTIEAVRFDGLLRITDPDLCWAGMGAGIGPAKAYGCGLLSLGKP